MEDLSYLFVLRSTLTKEHANTPFARQTERQSSFSQFLYFSPGQHHSLTSSSVESPHLNQVQPSNSAVRASSELQPLPRLSGSPPACCEAAVMVSKKISVKTVFLNRFLLHLVNSGKPRRLCVRILCDHKIINKNVISRTTHSIKLINIYEGNQDYTGLIIQRPCLAVKVILLNEPWQQ